MFLGYGLFWFCMLGLEFCVCEVGGKLRVGFLEISK